MSAFGDDLTKLFCVPVDDHRGREVQSGQSVILGTAGTITDFVSLLDSCTYSKASNEGYNGKLISVHNVSLSWAEGAEFVSLNEAMTLF